jgi:non-ribosomal peptide synthetase component F
MLPIASQDFNAAAFLPLRHHSMRPPSSPEGTNSVYSECKGRSRIRSKPQSRRQARLIALRKISFTPTISLRRCHRARDPRLTRWPAYLLFTSGSTGEPKGVAISNSSLCSYLDCVCATYEYAPDDCHSQTFELNFDLSVHDMMCAWTSGGAIIPIVGKYLLAPESIVERERITCWFSVLSLGLIMQRSDALRANRLRSLRVSLFCGEPLPTSLAEE